MNAKKSDRNVSKMDVLKDIRGLLSASQEQDVSKKASSEDKGVFRAETAVVEEEVRRYKGLVQKQQEELDRLRSENKALAQKQQELDGLRSENKELLAKLDTFLSNKGKPIAPSTDKSSWEIAQIEARTAELSLALSQVEGLVQLKTKELLGRLARVYQEAGQGEIALEFRRGRDEMEVVENLARFVQALVNE